MVRKSDRISIYISKEVLSKVEEMGEEENRSRSNVIETILRKYFNVHRKRKIKPTRYSYSKID